MAAAVSLKMLSNKCGSYKSGHVLPMHSATGCLRIPCFVLPRPADISSVAPSRSFHPSSLLYVLGGGVKCPSKCGIAEYVNIQGVLACLMGWGTSSFQCVLKVNL